MIDMILGVFSPTLWFTPVSLFIAYYIGKDRGWYKGRKELEKELTI